LHLIAKRAVRVKSVALYNGRQRLDFRYTLLATKLARHCNMSRWANCGLMQRNRRNRGSSPRCNRQLMRGIEMPKGPLAERQTASAVQA
jgi:hypothetical protein